MLYCSESCHLLYIPPCSHTRKVLKEMRSPYLQNNVIAHLSRFSPLSHTHLTTELDTEVTDVELHVFRWSCVFRRITFIFRLNLLVKPHGLLEELHKLESRYAFLCAIMIYLAIQAKLQAHYAQLRKNISNILAIRGVPLLPSVMLQIVFREVVLNRFGSCPVLHSADHVTVKNRQTDDCALTTVHELALGRQLLERVLVRSVPFGEILTISITIHGKRRVPIVIIVVAGEHIFC